MMRGYYGIEDLGLTAGQRATLVAALRELGANNADPNPCNRNHTRVRLDGLAVIFEARWNSEEWTTDSLAAILGSIFGIDPATIGVDVQQSVYGPVATFSRNGDKLRLIAFGGVDATYAESHAAVLAFLVANAAAWEPVE